MKNPSRPLFALLGVAILASCSFAIGGNSIQFDSVTRDVYSTARYASGKTRQECKVKTLTFRVNPVREHILYCDLPTYADMVGATFGLGFSYSASASQWVVKNTSGNIFVGGIDKTNGRFYTSGSFAQAYQTEAPEYGTLMWGLSTSSEVIAQGSGYQYCSFTDFDTQVPIYYSGDTVYCPVALFDMVFGQASGLYHFDNLTDFYQYSSSSELGIPMDKVGNPIKHDVAKYHEVNKMPADLRLLEKACFYFYMDNFYGLRVHKGIESMATYYRSLGYDTAMLDIDDTKRSYAYFDAFAVLNDDHTGLVAMAEHWGDDRSQSHRGPLSVDRQYLAAGLSALRQEAYQEKGGQPLDSVLYSDSGETAYFSFDSFSFESKPYQEDGKTVKEDLWKTDTAAYFLRQFDAIGKKGGVKRVIIDDSINGGGTLGVAMKLLALVSKDNKGEFGVHSIGTGSISRTYCRYDSNGDGLYDANDVYGDDYEIFILTSPRSFSCGNLFPCMARKSGVKILGFNSGGGECVVGSTLLPSGREMRNSSMSRLVDIDADGRSYRGLEKGAGVNIPLTYAAFYDVNAIEGILNNIKA